MSYPQRKTNDPREKRWQRLFEATASIQIQSITISDSNVFADQTIDFPRVAAIVGRHGTGKSLLLKTIESLFGYPTAAYAPPFIDLNQTGNYHLYNQAGVTGIFRVTLASPSGLIERTVDLESPPQERMKEWEGASGEYPSALYTTPTAAFSDINMMFQNYHYTPDMNEGEYERDATREELDAIRNITGRTYERIKFRTAITDKLEGYPYYDLFVVGIEDGRQVQSWMMSQGELWVHYVLGHFLAHDLSDKNIALLDEPETFLSSTAQRPFIDQVAKQILKKDSQLIVGTHSFDVLNRFPLANIRVCLRLNGMVHVITPTTFSIVKDALGVESPIRILILVEDRFAADVLRVLFSIYDVALARDAEIVQCGGESEVIAGIRILRDTQRISCVGVLDGDRRREPIKMVGAEKIAFLPGNEAPETELLKSALLYIDHLSTFTGRTMSDVKAAISLCLPADHQYQITQFASYLGLSRDAATDCLVRIWMKDSGIELQARNLLTELRAGVTINSRST
ncbi:hypothetical protein AB0L05_15980 [Nonomuraea pusilla]|uniref:ATP-dependent nuclease n=1 Tax=Nonomuraea pusilla TaxID=46177 RepID=UPI003325B7FD